MVYTVIGTFSLQFKPTHVTALPAILHWPQEPDPSKLVDLIPYPSLLTLNFPLNENSLHSVSHAALFHTSVVLLILCSLPETLLVTLPPSQLPLMPFKTLSFSASSSPDPNLKLGYMCLLCVPTASKIASSYNTS